MGHLTLKTKMESYVKIEPYQVWNRVATNEKVIILSYDGDNEGVITLCDVGEYAFVKRDIFLKNELSLPNIPHAGDITRIGLSFCYYDGTKWIKIDQGVNDQTLTTTRTCDRATFVSNYRRDKTCYVVQLQLL